MKCTRSADTVARLGGDEFAILVEGEVSPRRLVQLADEVIDAVRSPVRLTGRQIVVSASLAVGAAIIIEAVLSFLGFGIKPPNPSLGSLIASGQQFPQKWWITVFPGLVLLTIVMSINFVGDGLRDALDPQQRRVRA